MKYLTLRLPRQTKLALIALGIIGVLVIVLLGYNVLHQIQDVPIKSNLLKMISAIVADTFTNHIVWELVLNVLVVFSLTVFGKNIIHQMKLYRSWNRYANAYSDLEMFNSVVAKFKHERIRFVILNEPKMIAMTIGFLKPKIVLSSYVIERFDENELEAIIYHELYHYKSRHPLQLFILNVVADCLAFLPVVKELVQHYKVWMELLADRYSIKRMGSEVPISHVLLAVLKNEQLKNQALGVHFANEAINYRLMQLIEPNKEINIPLFNWRKMTTSLFMLQVMLSIFIYSCV
ncbi:M56 family metallopeptidase [Paenibacillus glufosinatiresistens]|uniref:M56 family metallopeptidase n=1 Tax=Paenibacillus glufosinatiresistens TaxID=3070657 RepID=UPI00286DB304|nr:M56 family metallopeptidase [Paenibacillus sp. YX.27]